MERHSANFHSNEAPRNIGGVLRKEVAFSRQGMFSGMNFGDKITDNRFSYTPVYNSGVMNLGTHIIC